MEDDRQFKFADQQSEPAQRLVCVWVCVLTCVFLVSQVGCQPIQSSHGAGIGALVNKLSPSNDRDWKPNMAVLPWAESNGSLITVRNVRNSQYTSADHYLVDHYDRTFDLSSIETADYIVCPFNGADALAHTMISFGLSDDSHIVVSAEVRKEKGEKYSAVLGLGRKFELMYVVADEKDVIGARTKHRDTDVYVFPTVATPYQAQALFVDVMERVNQLAVKPEFYNTVTNNCTTNLQNHVNRLANNKVKYNWKVLLPSHSARYAYDLGLMDNSISFEDLQALSWVNDLSNAHIESADYSDKIRQRRPQIRRLAERNTTGQTSSVSNLRLR